MRKKFLLKFTTSLILTMVAFFPFLAKASVYINEVAWMGISGVNGQYGEWIEFYNSSDQEINLVDWKLYRNGGLLESDSIFTLTKSIQPKGHLVIERTTSSIPDPLPSINDETGSFGGGNLANLPNGEFLVLKDNNDNTVQSFDFSSGWPAGDNSNKFTMQKISSGWITATGTPKAVNSSQAASQSSSSSSQESQSSSANSSSSLSSAGAVIASGSVAYNYKNEQISAMAGEDKTAVAGADVVLEGNALGFKKEPLLNARYLWTLGDGSYKEGKNIRHVYKYPGNYIAVLNVSSGDISASDRINIKVIQNELQIIDAKDEFIKLKNKSGIILDVSGWFLKAGGAIFKFPDYSLVAANSELIISSDISKLKFADSNFSAELLYPNSSAAFSYPPAGEASPPVYLSSSSSVSKSKEIILSKPPEKKVEVAIVPSVVSSKNYSSLPALPTGQAGGEAYLASVITIVDKNNSSSKLWLILALIAGIIGGAGVFLARKNNQSPKN